MTTTNQTSTADELWRTRPDGRRRELVRGELRTMAPAGGGHGKVTVALTAPLAMHVQANALGVVLAAETGFILHRNPDTVRAPDIAFISQGRLPPGGVPEGFIPLAPDLAVEVVSPGDTLIEVEEKVQDWLDAGTQRVWVVNPRRRTVTIHRADGDPRILRTHDTLDGEDLVPGFTLKIEALFA